MDTPQLQPPWQQGLVSSKTIFPQTWVGLGWGLGMVHMHYIHRSLYFYYYYVISTQIIRH